MAIRMTMGRIFLGSRHAPSLMGWDSILINGFEMDLRFFFKSGTGSSITPSRPAMFYFFNEMGIGIVLNKKDGIGMGATHHEPVSLPNPTYRVEGQKG